MGIKIGELDIGEEILNSKVNLDTLLNLLFTKGLITEQEFIELREKIIQERYSKYIVKNGEKNVKNDP